MKATGPAGMRRPADAGVSRAAARGPARLRDRFADEHAAADDDEPRPGLRRDAAGLRGRAMERVEHAAGRVGPGREGVGCHRVLWSRRRGMSPDVSKRSHSSTSGL